YSIGVAQAVPPEDVRVRDPDEVERGEAQRERDESAKIGLQCYEVFRDFEADDKKSRRECEHRIAECFDSSRLVLAVCDHVSALASASEISPSAARSSATVSLTVPDDGACPLTAKYFASGWWMIIAAVDCSGSSWNDS